MSYGRSGDRPLDDPVYDDFPGTLPDREDQEKIAHTKAEGLYGLGQPASAADDLAAAQLQGQS
jgi:hypothetical protein